MSISISAIWNGLYAHLTGTSDFNTSVGGRVYLTNAPDNPTLPYAVVTVVDDVPLEGFDLLGYETRVQIDVYADLDSPRDCMDVADDLRARLHRTNFTISGADNMGAEMDVQRGAEREDERYRVSADYIIRGFETGA